MNAGLGTVLLVYLEVSLMLFVAWLIFAMTVRVLGARPGLLGHAEWVRVGRVLLVVALLAPVLATLTLAWIPGPTVQAVALDRTTEVASPRLASPSSDTATSLNRLRNFFGRQEPRAIERAGMWLGIVLLLGIVRAAVRSWIQFRRLRQLLGDAVPLRRIGRVQVLVSDHVQIPFSTLVAGCAQIVLPVGVLSDSPLLRVILRHELQHHRQGDGGWALGFEAVNILFFWHPAVRAWCRELHDLQELACDEAVIRQGVQAEHYGQCLLRVADMAVRQRPFASVAMAGVSDRAGQLRRRLECLIDSDRELSSRRWHFAVRGVCISTVLAATAVTALAWPSVSDVRPRIPAVTAMAPILEALGARQAAPAVEFRSEQGQYVDLASLRGGVVLVDFWDADCRFCAQDARRLSALRRRFAGEQFSIVGVSVSPSVEAFESFVEQHQVTWPQLHEHEGLNGPAAVAFAPQAIPSHYVIDRDGRFIHVPLGQPLERVIAALLEE